MKTNKVCFWVWLGFVSGIVFLAIVLLLTEKYTCYYKSGYRQGQIDSLTGKINYKLKEHKDKTKTWEIIDENK